MYDDAFNQLISEQWEVENCWFVMKESSTSFWDNLFVVINEHFAIYQKA